MATRLSVTSIKVLDQEEALDFYVNKLGLEKGQDIKQELPGGTSRRIEVNLPAGTYRFFCDVPGHESIMEGVLTVR